MIERMAPTTIVTTYDLGKQMKCLVTVSDSAGETVQVETDQQHHPGIPSNAG